MKGDGWEVRGEGWGVGVAESASLAEHACLAKPACLAEPAYLLS